LNPLKQGDPVLNSKCPEWGTGVVIQARGDVVDVEFTLVGRKSVHSTVLQPTSAELISQSDASRSTDRTNYESDLRLLVSRFISIANRAGIEKLEAKIFMAFLGSGKGRSEVKRQLHKWVQTTPHGRHDQANADAVALWNFLFPDAKV